MGAETTKPNPRTYYVTLRAKLLLVFTLLFVVTFAVVFFGFYSYATILAMNNLKRDLKATALTAASGIDGDAFVDLYQNGQMDDPTYSSIAEFLRSIKRANPKAAGMYTFLKLPDETDQVRFVVSAALPPGVAPSARDAALIAARPQGCTVASANRPKMGDSWTEKDGLTVAALNSVREAGVDDATYTDKWGTWLSGYAPIYNAAGEPVGAVGVDMCAVDVAELQRNISQTVLPAFAITLVGLIVAVLAISSTVTRPIVALTRAAQRIAQGDYEQDLSAFRSGRLRDEVAALTEVFELMVSKVHQREQTLRRQVEELKIEIDEAKRQKQVSEIIDSDYFQRVQSRAMEMRKRRQQIDSTATTDES
jgi:methyl-accepting chemotaxis protein